MRPATGRARARRRRNRRGRDRRRAEIEENTRVHRELPFPDGDREEEEGDESTPNTPHSQEEESDQRSSSEETVLYTYSEEELQDNPDAIDSDPRTETVRMTCWNIGGRRGAMRFSEKLHAEYTRKVLESNDIVAFIETHTDEDEIFDYEDFELFHFPRKKYGNAIHASGGIVLAVRRTWISRITIDPRSEHWCVAAYIKQTERDTITALFTYLAPTKSSYVQRTGEDFLTMLEKTLEDIPRGNKVLMMGDFNKRIAEREGTTYMADAVQISQPGSPDLDSEYWERIPELQEILRPAGT